MGHDFNTNSLRLIRKNSKIADHKTVNIAHAFTLMFGLYKC